MSQSQYHRSDCTAGVTGVLRRRISLSHHFIASCNYTGSNALEGGAIAAADDEMPNE